GSLGAKCCTGSCGVTFNSAVYVGVKKRQYPRSYWGKIARRYGEYTLIATL
ncbi:hypothetical protein A2U01_0062990, partial [Trifolium medium]|nr:hypothetical protein [Trifolium medium]